MMPMRKRFNTRQRIYESVESAILEAISAQVLGISVVISSARNVEISMFIDHILPESERSYLAIVMEEIMYGPPWVADVSIAVLDNAIQPLTPVGTWLFIRKGVQADRDVPAATSVKSLTSEQSSARSAVAADQEDDQPDSEQESSSLVYYLSRQTARHIVRRPNDRPFHMSLHA